MIFSTGATKNAMMSYTPYYITIAAVMVGALIIFLSTVKEKQWAAQMQSDAIRYNIEEKSEDEEQPTQKRSLSKGEKFSLICILLSVALWYFGYNAVTSKYSVYAGKVLNLDYNTTGVGCTSIYVLDEYRVKPEAYDRVITIKPLGN